VTDRGVEGPPDLVVEVLSPSTADRDRGIKLERYRLYGVPAYWVVDPDERTLELWDLAGGATKPIVLGAADTLRWTPLGSAATLEIVLAELFGAE
jgi:Uma2 family endonuclease